MMYERSAPEAPTSEPVMISSVFDSMKPAAAAAHPEYEFSIDTTTGMSPPPMAATRCQPTEADGHGHQVEEVAGRQGQRSGLDLRRELEVGHDRPGQRDGADEDAQEHLDQVGGAAPVALGQVRVEADQHCGHADEAVQHRDDAD